jgi:hypothetical protein
VYRLLLRLYPARTRDANADDMVQLFADRLRDAASAREVATVWVELVVDVVRTAPREHLVARRRRQLVEGPPMDAKRVPMKHDAVFAALPLVASLVVILVHPLEGVWGHMYTNPPGFLGQPVGLAILVMLAVPASGGLLAARRNRELNDPWHQALFLAAMLAPAPALVVFVGIGGASYYALAGTVFLLVARFRRLMLALSIPFLAWLVVGPVVMGVVVPILQGLGEAP